jgi:ligand-binding sensor domain-containing protein
VQFPQGFTSRKFKSLTIDNNNIKWFATEAGIVSFNGSQWTLHNKNRKIPQSDMREIAYDFSSYGHEVWVATPQGALVATLPVDARSGATTYYSENSQIGSENVLSVAVGKNALRWFGTDKGIAAFSNRKWLKPDYLRKYPESMFRDYPITAMATSPDGDSLYVATEGAGVTRVFRNKVDAISGASEYAQWGPIEIPSDKVYSVFIQPDGTQWFGTDKGAARHKGYNTLEGWTVFDSKSGIVNDHVQAIAADRNGRIWLGTRGGISIYDGKKWISVTEKDGLPVSSINCIACDREGTVWIGTENGVISFRNNELVIYN